MKWSGKREAGRRNAQAAPKGRRAFRRLRTFLNVIQWPGHFSRPQQEEVVLGALKKLCHQAHRCREVARERRRLKCRSESSAWDGWGRTWPSASRRRVISALCTIAAPAPSESLRQKGH